MSNEHGATPAGGDAAVQRTRKEIATDRLTPVFRDGNGGGESKGPEIGDEILQPGEAGTVAAWHQMESTVS